MKQLTIHRQLDFSWSSCYSKKGSPIANYPPMIMVEPRTISWEEIDNLVKQHIADNGFEYDSVRDYLYSLIPDEFECTVYNNRKTILDFMRVGGVYGQGAVAVVRKCIKDIIEKIPSTRDEYLFKEITILRKGEEIEGDVYLLIMPKIPQRELVATKCLYRDNENNVGVVFDNIEELCESARRYSALQFTLPAKYRDLQMLYLEGSGLFVSDKIATALHMANDYADGYEFGIRMFFDE